MDTVNRESKELWKSPPSLSCLRIEVSNHGRVRTLPYLNKVVRLGKVILRRQKGKVFSPSRDTRGRLILPRAVASHKGQRHTSFLVHRLVAECFVYNPNPQKYNMVFFKDGDVSNCSASNLEWGSREEKNKRVRGRNVLLTVSVYSKDMKKIGEYAGCGEAGRALGCSKQAIHSSIKRGGRCKGVILYAKRRVGCRPCSTDEEKKSEKNVGFYKGDEFLFPESLYG